MRGHLTFGAVAYDDVFLCADQAKRSVVFTRHRPAYDDFEVILSLAGCRLSVPNDGSLVYCGYRVKPEDPGPVSGEESANGEDVKAISDLSECVMAVYVPVLVYWIM